MYFGSTDKGVAAILHSFLPEMQSDMAKPVPKGGKKYHAGPILQFGGFSQWQPTPVFLPGESQERWSLVGCRL